MKLLLLLVATVLAKHGSESYFPYSEVQLKEMFAEWQKQYDQMYETSDEQDERFRIWTETFRKIKKHNDNPNTTYTLGLNAMTAMTDEEFKAQYLCKMLKPKSQMSWNHQKNMMAHGAFNPTSVDWSQPEGKYVTPVKNQGGCGSCWAFSTTGALESRSAIAGEALVSLSEQQLVDCSKLYGNHGCEGGLMDNAFKYIRANGGLCSEEEYPYKGKDGRCEASKCSKKYDAISGFTDVSKDQEAALETAVVAGPVSIAIEADQFSFRNYKSGVITGVCGDKLDHGVLVVGYGEEAGKQFWKVKNSWGGSWGESGYVKICRDCHKDGSHGECGILDDPSFPLPEKAMH